jgi:hypothetical protein
MWKAAGWVVLVAVLAGCGNHDRVFETAVADGPIQPLPDAAFDPQPTQSANPDKPLPIPAVKPSDKTLLAARKDLDPERLIGLSLVEAEALLGEPALQDEKPPAKVWTYNAQSCVLSIFFYADISTKDFRALTYEIRNEQEVKHESSPKNGNASQSQQNDQEKSELADRQCLAELIKEHAT